MLRKNKLSPKIKQLLWIILAFGLFLADFALKSKSPDGLERVAIDNSFSYKKVNKK